MFARVHADETESESASAHRAGEIATEGGQTTASGSHGESVRRLAGVTGQNGSIPPVFADGSTDALSRRLGAKAVTDGNAIALRSSDLRLAH